VYLVFEFLRSGFKKIKKGVEDSIVNLPEMLIKLTKGSPANLTTT